MKRNSTNVDDPLPKVKSQQLFNSCVRWPNFWSCGEIPVNASTMALYEWWKVDTLNGTSIDELLTLLIKSAGWRIVAHHYKCSHKVHPCLWNRASYESFNRFMCEEQTTFPDFVVGRQCIHEHCALSIQVQVCNEFQIENLIFSW